MEKNIEFRNRSPRPMTRKDRFCPAIRDERGRSLKGNIASERFKLFEISEKLDGVAQPLFGKNEYGLPRNVGFPEPGPARICTVV